MENPAILLRRLNPYCARAMEGAASLCQTRAHAEILPEHWLLKLLEQGEGDLTVLARRYEWDMDTIWQDMLGFLDSLPRSVRSRPQLSEGVQSLMQDAWLHASLAGETHIRSQHLLMAVVVILVLSASMSTLSSLVLTSSSTLTLDLIRDHLVKGMSQKKQVLVMRCLIVVFIAISVVLAIIQYKSNVTFIAQLMGVSWGALAGAFLAPFLYGLYWKKATRAACWTSFLFSTVVMTANIFFQASFPALLRSPINAGAFCMLAGLVLVPVVSLLTPQPDAALVEDAFSCYDRKVLVRQREALGDGEKAG